MGYSKAAFPNIRVRRYFKRIRPRGGSLASGDTMAGLGPVVISDYVQVSGDTNPTAPVNSTHNNILRAIRSGSVSMLMRGPPLLVDSLSCKWIQQCFSCSIHWDLPGRYPQACCKKGLPLKPKS